MYHFGGDNSYWLQVSKTGTHGKNCIFNLTTYKLGNETECCNSVLRGPWKVVFRWIHDLPLESYSGSNTNKQDTKTPNRSIMEYPGIKKK